MNTTTKLPEAIEIMDEIAAINFKDDKIIKSCTIYLDVKQLEQLDLYMLGLRSKKELDKRNNKKPIIFIRGGIEFTVIVK